MVPLQNLKRQLHGHCRRPQPIGPGNNQKCLQKRKRLLTPLHPNQTEGKRFSKIPRIHILNSQLNPSGSTRRIIPQTTLQKTILLEKTKLTLKITRLSALPLVPTQTLPKYQGSSWPTRHPPLDRNQYMNHKMKRQNLLSTEENLPSQPAVHGSVLTMHLPIYGEIGSLNLEPG